VVYYKWKKKTSKGVQIEFLCFLLVGLLMISIGGLTLALEPSTGTCTASVWFSNVGFITELVVSTLHESILLVLLNIDDISNIFIRCYCNIAGINMIERHN
jgi:hypothetical protein